MKSCICLVLLVCIGFASAAPRPDQPPYKPEPAPAYKVTPYKDDELPPQPYSFQYGVSDQYSGTNYKAVESQDEKGTVLGSYVVNLPDGRTQTVTYHADAYGGFVADVKYEGEAQYPPEPAEGYGNTYKLNKKSAGYPVPVKSYAPEPPIYKESA